MHAVAGRLGKALRPRRLATGALLLVLVVAPATYRFDTLLKSQAHGKTVDQALDPMLGPPSPALPTVIEVSRSRLAPKGADHFQAPPRPEPPPKPPQPKTPAAAVVVPPEPPPAAPLPPLFEPAPPANRFGAPFPGRPLTARVALLLPISGPNRGLGAAMQEAAQLALFEIADDNLVLLTYDTGGTPAGAVAAATRAVQDGAGLILGPLFAASARQVAPIAGGAGLNVISFSNDRTIAGNNVYVMGFLPDDQVANVVDFAIRQGLARFAALVPNTAYGNTVVRTLQQALRRWGGELTRIAFYEPTDADIAPVVRTLADYDNRAKALEEQRQALEESPDPVSQQALKRLEGLETIGDIGFDAVLLSEGGDRLRAIAPLLPYYDIDPTTVRFLGTAQWDDPDLGQEPALLGGWYAAPPLDTRAGFTRRFEAVFGRRPPRLATLAYDATALAAVLARAQGGPDFGVRALTQPSGFAGIDGIFRFRPDGVVQRGLAILQVRRQGAEVIRPAPRVFDTGPSIN